MRQQADLIKETLMNEHGYLYICGSTRMGHDVQQLLKDILTEEGFKKLDLEKRLVKELWG